MNRLHVVLACSTLAMFGAAIAKTEKQTWQDRLEAFRVQTQAAYDKSGTKAPLYYGTPELTLKGHDEPIVVHPGQTVEVVATGNYPKGSLALFDCDELELVSLNQTDTEVKAKVKVPTSMFPEECH